MKRNRTSTTAPAWGRLAALGLLTSLASTTLPLAAHAAEGGSPIDTLIGSWGGNGSFKLQDGKTVRIKCNAYYTGGGAQLGMVVRCSGQDGKIEIRSKLSYSNSRLSGSWEERTYNAEGAVTGEASENRISMKISGGVAGAMKVNFTQTHQDVSISTQGIPLKSVNVSMTRR